MVTTIQINEQTLGLLKRIKEETKAKSYDEAINKIVINSAKEKYKSIGGSLKKYYKNKSSEIIESDQLLLLSSLSIFEIKRTLIKDKVKNGDIERIIAFIKKRSS